MYEGKADVAAVAEREDTEYGTLTPELAMAREAGVTPRDDDKDLTEILWQPTRPDKNTVRERAYEIWEAEGRPEGRALDNWLCAEMELRRPDRVM